MGLLQLNEDALLSIVEYLDCYDALRLSEVARPVHVVAKHQALKSVEIHSHLALVNFCRHMLGPMSHRIPHLVTIKARIRAVSSEPPLSARWRRHFRRVDEFHEAGSIFADLLERATNLRMFLLSHAEVWMEYEPRIASALTCLRHLEDLQLADIGPMVALVLNKMQSRPDNLAIVEGPSTNPRLMQSQFPLEQDLCFPSVHHLTVWGDCALPFFTRFASICPNLRTLDLGSSWSTSNFPPDMTGYEDTATWRYLERVDGLPDALEEIPSEAPIHCIRLTYNGVSPRARGRLMVVHTAQPVSLSIPLTPDDRPDLWLRMLQASSRLRHLCLSVLNWPFRLDMLFEKVMPFVAQSRVICLELHCVLRDPQGRIKDSDRSDHLRMVLPPLAASVPSLQFVSLNLTLPKMVFAHEPPPKVQCWWRISGLGAARAAEAFEVTRGERISAYLSSPAYDCTVAFDDSVVP